MGARAAGEIRDEQGRANLSDVSFVLNGFESRDRPIK